ncbi:MAG: sugar phosphate isomerase/epimerase, partial [Verrucomicrobiota bacterium]
MNRRTFLQTAIIGVPALARLSWASALAADKTNWPVGCFNRPWTKWSYDDALDGIAAAGYKLTGLLSAHKGEAFTSSAAMPEYLDGLKQRIAKRGLAVNMTTIRFRPDAALEDNIGDLHK